MKILLVEDDDIKSRLIKTFLQQVVDNNILRLEWAATVSTAGKLIYENQYDLIIVDILLPFHDGGGPVLEGGTEVVNAIRNSALNGVTSVICLSAVDEAIDKVRDVFTKKGIFICPFDREETNWKEWLQSILSGIKYRLRYDFAIICALREEVEAFNETTAVLGQVRSEQGLLVRDLNIGTLRGICVELRRVGPAYCAATTAKAVESFDLSVVCMSGICGGFSSNVKLGQLVIASPCWDYRSGKWAKSDFRLESYQVDINGVIRSELTEICEDAGLMDRLERDLSPRAEERALPVFAPFVSGSAVVASADRLEPILDTHRKVAAIDMEMYGFYRAMEICAKPNVKWFGVKCVVDLADDAKDDRLHRYGAVVSARFVTEYFGRYEKQK